MTTAAQVDQSLKNARTRSRSASFGLQDSSQDIVAGPSQQTSRSSEVDNRQDKSLGHTTTSTHCGKLKLGKVRRLSDLVVSQTEHDGARFKDNEYTSLVQLQQAKSDVVNIIAIVSGRMQVKEMSGGGKQRIRHLQYPCSIK